MITTGGYGLLLWGELMRNTKSYGVVSCWQEHRMLVHAEHTFERKQKKTITSSKKVTVIDLHKRRRCGEMT